MIYNLYLFVNGKLFVHKVKAAQIHLSDNWLTFTNEKSEFVSAIPRQHIVIVEPPTEEATK